MQEPRLVLCTLLPARANKRQIEIWPLDLDYLECSAYINSRWATAEQEGIRKELGAYSEQGGWLVVVVLKRNEAPEFQGG